MATQLCLLPPEPLAAAARRPRTRPLAPAPVVDAPPEPRSRRSEDRLDDHTREIGRRGIEAARKALAAAVARSTAA
jgi:hypothetical protein